MTMPTTTRPRISPVTSPTAWPHHRAAASAARAGPSAASPADGERGGAGRPVEQLGAEFAFELADLGADAGLADVHPLGGTGEVGLLGDRDEVLQLPQFHDC